MECITDLVSKFWKARELLLNTSADTLPTAKLCLQLFGGRMIFECEKGSVCYQDEPLLLVDVYLKQVLSLDFDKARTRKAIEAKKVFLRTVVALAPRRRGEVWTLQPVLVPVQPFRVRIMHFLGNVYKEATSLEK